MATSAVLPVLGGRGGNAAPSQGVVPQNPGTQQQGIDYGAAGLRNEDPPPPANSFTDQAGLLIQSDTPDKPTPPGHPIGPADAFVGFGRLQGEVLSEDYLQRSPAAAILDKYRGYGLKFGVLKDTDGTPWIFICDYVGPERNGRNPNPYDWNGLFYTYSPPRPFNLQARVWFDLINNEIRDSLGVRETFIAKQTDPYGQQPGDGGWNVYGDPGWDENKGLVYGVEVDFPPLTAGNETKEINWDGRMTCLVDRWTRLAIFERGTTITLRPQGSDFNGWSAIWQFLAGAITFVVDIFKGDYWGAIKALIGLEGIGEANLEGFGAQLENDTGIPQAPDLSGSQLMQGVKNIDQGGAPAFPGWLLALVAVAVVAFLLWLVTRG